MSRKIIILVGFLFVSFFLFSQNSYRKILVAVDGFAPAIKVGLKRNVSERLLVQGSAGFCIFGPSLLSYNVFGTYLLTSPQKPFGFHVNFGLLDNYIDLTGGMFSFGFGGGAGVHYIFQNKSMFTFRTGVIAGPAFDNSSTDLLAIPNFGIEYAFPF